MYWYVSYGKALSANDGVCFTSGWDIEPHFINMMANTHLYRASNTFFIRPPHSYFAMFQDTKSYKMKDWKVKTRSIFCYFDVCQKRQCYKFFHREYKERKDVLNNNITSNNIKCLMMLTFGHILLM